VTGKRLSRWLNELLGRKAPEPALKPLVQDRFFMYDDQKIAYTLIRRPRKSIGFRITEKGLEVSAPSWVSVKAIEEGLIEKASWIKKHMSRIESASALRQDRYEYYLEHKRIPLWGQSIPMVNTDKQGFRLVQANHVADEQSPALVLHLAKDVSRERLIAWLKREAHRDFEPRIKRFTSAL